MAPIKFFVHGDGIWREVDTNNGGVTGWGKIQFVYLRRGRLVVARHNSVLKGLKALVAGNATTVRDGPPLPQIRRKKKYKTKAVSNVRQLKHGHCCSCQHNCINHHQQSISDTLFNSLQKPSTNSTATQCVLTVNNATQAIQKSDAHNRSDSDKCTEIEKIKPIEHSVLNIKDGLRKELLIDEEDVLLVRSFIEQDEKNIFNMSLIDFDTFDNCKRKVFYKINPLVIVSRSRRIAEMCNRPQSQGSSVTLKDFIAGLGLQNIKEVRKKCKYNMRARKSQVSEKNENFISNTINISDTDKENISVIKSNRGKQLLANNINKSSKNQSYLHLKRNNDRRSLKDTENNKDTPVKKKEKEIYSSDSETLKVSLNRDLFLKRSQTKDLIHSKNVIREVSSLKNESLNNKSRKLRSEKDFRAEDSKTKEYGDNKSKQTFTLSINDGKIPQKNLLDQSLQSRRAENNKPVKTRPYAAEVNKGQSYNKKRKEIADFSLVTDEDNLFYKGKTIKKSKNENAIIKQFPDSNVQQPENNNNRNKETPENNLSNTKRNCSRPYSRREDEAIVSWLRDGERANLVKGNRVWKELQPLHHKSTGQYRPWQSLRNRYLRYVLPALADLPVPPSVAQKLRAAAAQGEIKTKTTPASSNSIFKDTPVRSAWALRPRPSIRTPSIPTLAAVHPKSVASHVSVPTSPSTSGIVLRSRAPTASTSNTAQALTKTRHDTGSDTPGNSNSLSKRPLRAAAAHSPSLPTPKRKIKRDSSVTYSELIRRFASRHRSTPQAQNTSSSSSDFEQEKRPQRAITLSDTSVDQQSDSSRSSSDAVGRRRSKRFKIKIPGRSRYRRLYNPRVV